MNTTTHYVLQEGALQKYPLQMGPLLKRFSLVTPKSIADKYVIQSKILPALTEANDINVSLPTMYCMLDTCHVSLNDPVASYFPAVEADSMISCLKTMIDQLPLEEASSVLPAFSSLVEEVSMEAESFAKVPYLKERRQFAIECSQALSGLSDYLNKERDVIVGHSLSSKSSSPEVSVGNTYLAKYSAFSPNSVPDEEDLRQVIFTDPFDSAKLEVVMDIGKAVGEAIAAMTDKSTAHSLLDGAEVALEGISSQVMNYLVEIRCGASNLQSMQEFCEKTNYDMECYLNQTTTEEDCVPDVTNQQFGWSDEDILCHGGSADTGKMDDALSYIFSKPNITGKNIQYVFGAIGVTPDDMQRKELVENLKSSICNTLLWENQQPNYSDLPINTFVVRTKQLMEHLSKNTIYEARLSEAFGTVTRAMVSTMETEGIVQQGVFQAAPSALSLCPFPVGVRLTQQYFDDIYRAETDEELTEAMIQFSKGLFESSTYSVQEGLFNRTNESFSKEDVKKSLSNVEKILRSHANDLNKDEKWQDTTRKQLDRTIKQYPNGKYAGFDKNEKVPPITLTKVSKSISFDDNDDADCLVYFTFSNCSFDVTWSMHSVVRELIKRVNNDPLVKKDPIVKKVYFLDSENDDKEGYIAVGIHQKIYNSVSNNKSSVVEEAFFNKDFDKSVVAYDFNKFKSGSSSILVITGLTNRGQSALASKLAKKYHKKQDTEVIHMGNFGKVFPNERLSYEQFASRVGDTIAQYLMLYDIGYYSYISQHYIERNGEYLGKVTENDYTDFFKYCLDNCNGDWRNNIIEGVRIPGCFDVSALKHLPILIVGTSGSQPILDAYKKGMTWDTMKKEDALKFLKWYWEQDNDTIDKILKQDNTQHTAMESNAVSKGARSASRGVQQKTEKAIRTAGGTGHEVKQAVKNAVDPMERYISQMMDKLKKADRDERREVILKGGTMPKVLRWVKRSIPIAIGAVVGAHGIPIAAVISGIALLGFIASDVTLDQRERRKILRELEDELEIVKEKIDDSRGDENKQKKYELIRIRNEIQRNMDKVRYHLKD